MIVSSPLGSPVYIAGEDSLGRLRATWDNTLRLQSRFSTFRLRPCGGGHVAKSNLLTKTSKTLDWLKKSYSELRRVSHIRFRIRVIDGRGLSLLRNVRSHSPDIYSSEQAGS